MVLSGRAEPLNIPKIVHFEDENTDYRGFEGPRGCSGRNLDKGPDGYSIVLTGTLTEILTGLLNGYSEQES